MWPFSRHFIHHYKNLYNCDRAAAGCGLDDLLDDLWTVDVTFQWHSSIANIAE